MGVSVIEARAELVRLAAPLEPNINHRSTLFGGSASAVAILAAWTLLHVRLSDQTLANRLVIQRNTMDYQRPITSNFIAETVAPDPDSWARFLSIFERKQRSRISLTVNLYCESRLSGILEGHFVALGDET